MGTKIENYYVQRNVSERFGARQPLKEMARTLLAEKSFCGGGILQVIENSMTEKEINKLCKEYALNSSTYEEIKEIPTNYRIRKLTPKECWRLMGVKDEDYDNVAKNQSNSSLYHLAGDSIVTTCLMGLFGEMLGIDYNDKINKLQTDIKGE